MSLVLCCVCGGYFEGMDALIDTTDGTRHEECGSAVGIKLDELRPAPWFLEDDSSHREWLEKALPLVHGAGATGADHDRYSALIEALRTQMARIISDHVACELPAVFDEINPGQYSSYYWRDLATLMLVDWMQN